MQGIDNLISNSKIRITEVLDLLLTGLFTFVKLELKMRIKTDKVNKKENTIFREFLQSNELRLTKEREEILQGILSIKGHFDTEELLIHLRKQNSKASLASIYRTIPLLIQSGLIEEVIKTEKHTRYELKYGKEHHDHMICERCGKLIEFHSEKLEKLQDEIAQSYEFLPLNHVLEIRGYCCNCQKC